VAKAAQSEKMLAHVVEIDESTTSKGNMAMQLVPLSECCWFANGQ